MIGTLRNNKKIMFILGVAVLGIWGSIAHQVVAALTTDEDVDAASVVSPNAWYSPAGSKFEYKDDVRDPFQRVKPLLKSASKAKVQPEPHPWAPPPIKLTGILGTGKRKTAMLEGADGTTFFLHEKDTVRGVNIVGIGTNAVTYVYQKKRAQWTLEGN